MPKTTVLSNGLRIVTEEIPQIPACQIVLKFAVGSAHEDAEKTGLAHFAEHMAFKGHSEAESLEILHAIEDLGGDFNASTGQESTTYYATVAASGRPDDDDFDVALAMMARNVTETHVSPAMLETERGVIIEELSMQRGDPGTTSWEAMLTGAWPGGWGRPCGGDPEHVARITPSDVEHWLKNYYYAGDAILSVAGNINHDHVVRLATKYLLALPAGNASVPASPDYVQYEENLGGGREQASVTIAYPCPGSPDLVYLATRHLVQGILCGSQTSRLWLALRERTGLVYGVDIGSMTSGGANPAGLTIVSLGCNPRNVAEVEQIIQAEIDSLAAGTITEEELAREIRRYERKVDMAAASIHHATGRNAWQIQHFGRIVDREEQYNIKKSLTVKNISDWAQAYLRSDQRTVVRVLPDD